MKRKKFTDRFLEWFNNIPVPSPYVGERTGIYVMLNRVTIVIAPIILGIAVTILVFLYLRGNKIRKSYSFGGEVQFVRKGEKGYPVVEVNGQEYYLDWNDIMGNQIEVGDSLFKKEGEFNIKLVRRVNGEVLYFRE